MGNAREFNAYQQQAAALARQAIQLAPTPGSAAPGRNATTATPSADPASLAHAVPWAALLLDAAPSDAVTSAAAQAIARFAAALEAATARDELLRITDPAGHWRDVYLPLAIHLALKAAERLDDADAAAALSAAAIAHLANAPASMPMALWSALCLREAHHDPAIVTAMVQGVLDQPGEDNALHAMTPDDSLDAWTWRELLGLHALAHLCQADARHTVPAAWVERLRAACDFHQLTTQPDHITTQPWSLPAFAMSEATQPFAGQQLHDAATQIALAQGRPLDSQTGGGAYVAGLLLADTAALLK